MLEEVGYTEEYIRSTIESYGVSTIKNTLVQWAPIGKTDYSAEEIEKQYLNIPGLSIIDPACGSGTFLYKAASRIVNAINKIDLTSREK
jgi:2-polyprenyl-3-methyl-5-hydroxy-6-metoxy-1,4-benzoquinol methylase